MLTGRAGVVTGGASGIGAAVVRRFAREGARIAILDIDRDGAERVAAGLPTGQAVCVRCDVSDETQVADAIAAAADALGTIDILVNNAGIPPVTAALEEADEADWDRMLDVHAKGCFLCSKHGFPRMKHAGRGGTATSPLNTRSSD